MGTHLRRQGELGQDRAAVAVDHHLHDRREAARAEIVGLTGARGVTEAECLIAQAMPLLQEQQPLGAQILLTHHTPLGQVMTGGDRQSERVLEQRLGRDLVAPDRQGQDQKVERAGDQRVDQMLGPALAQRQAQLRVGGVQPRQNLRQQIGPDRGNHAEAERTGEHPRALARKVDQILDTRPGCRGRDRPPPHRSR